jgi:predicted porin
MQKKLIAVAVAGALMPAAAMAQSTVQIFGNMYVEYSFWKSGANTANTVNPANADVLQTPGSEVGFRGEEKLGGGLSAWFQCTSTADPRGVSGEGWCTRNSAVGLRGSFGNFFIGNWDTPFKRNQHNIGGRDTGAFGTAFLLMGNSTTVDQGGNPGVFKRRQRNSINYDSPNFGGFTFGAAVSSTNNSTNITTTAAEAKPRIWSLSAAYRGGPLEVAAGYEKHTKAYNNGTAAVPGGVGATGAGAPSPFAPVAAVPATFAGDESGWFLSGAYRFGDVRLGALWTEQKADTGIGINAKVQAWHLGAEWKIQGPHNLAVGYTQADDMKGTVGAAMGARPTVTAGGNTGAKLYQIRYLHDFSKRTVGTIGYVNLKNDSSANYDLGGMTGTGTGAKSSAFVLSIAHRF